MEKSNRNAILKAGLTSLIVVFIFVGVILVWQARTSTGGKAPAIVSSDSQGFPRIKTKTLDGLEVDSLSLQGKILIVNFWASWCEPCVAEIPSLISLVNAFDGKVAVVAISNDDGREDIDAFIKSFPEFKNKNISLVWDETRDLMRQFGIQRLPQSFIVDKKGKLLKSIEGSINWHTPESEAFMKEILSRD